ncbi:hypothetical protein Tco_1242222 [Tanacetum coccineum]
MQFLIGLDDTYMQIRSSIFSRETLPDVRSAYATISSEVSHIVASGSIASSSKRNQASAFVSNVPNRNKFLKNEPKLNNVNNNRQGGGSGLVCKHYGFNGHTIDRCFKLISYLADFGKKSRQIFKNKNVSNNNIVGSSSSSGFTDEQLSTLVSLIKDNSLNEKNVQANMTGASQHMTHTDKELDNVYDISHLRGRLVRSILLFFVSKPCSACSRVLAGDIYGDHVVLCAGIIGIKHRHNVVRNTLVDIRYRSGISAGKEVDIGLDGGCDKPIRPADMLLYSWDGGLDVRVDQTGSSSLMQTGMADFVPGRAVINVAQRKRVKYMAKCATIRYGFIPFSFSSLGEL